MGTCTAEKYETQLTHPSREALKKRKRQLALFLGNLLWTISEIFCLLLRRSPWDQISTATPSEQSDHMFLSRLYLSLFTLTCASTILSRFISLHFPNKPPKYRSIVKPLLSVEIQAKLEGNRNPIQNTHCDSVVDLSSLNLQHQQESYRGIHPGTREWNSDFIQCYQSFICRSHQ